MIRELYKEIMDGNDVRQNLISLRTELKKNFNKSALLYLIGADYRLFDQLLEHEDAKVRKNVALIMGELEIPSFLEKIYQAYEKEEQLFVKSSYLIAMKGFDYYNLLPKLKERLDYLSLIDLNDSNKKHILDEIRYLNELIIQAEGVTPHEFIGYTNYLELVLLTNRNFKNITMNQLKAHKSKEFNAGVIVATNHLKEILDIRTYDEVLFILGDLRTCNSDVLEAAQAIANSSLYKFLETNHKEDAPFYFRIELKSKLPLDKKSAYTKRLSSEIERLTNRDLINTTSNYEFEIRLIENKEGRFNILIKLFTLPDNRFYYRKNTIATSINPVTSALIANLSKEYLQEDAQVLDPFCGVGTMLLERNKLVSAKTMYGLDIYGEAIEKAKENTKLDRTRVNYINRDYFDFKHEYLFDEIITNMPRIIGHKEEQEIATLYRKFFVKSMEHLKQNGIIILYSHNKEYVKRFLDRNVYKVEKEYEISKKEGAYLYIIRYSKTLS